MVKKLGVLGTKRIFGKPLRRDVLPVHDLFPARAGDGAPNEYSR
jgi:hypothetical protein